ncbi:uncharacterized protein LAESUDRAFT_759122 [Laetiporus sulphureus 93-53]|uniref:Uncharacterized protein n=1 Tax=Laetiporus sulphureus 93-53 TaxID=1314785 RepID=A0A165EAP2_9APHY|nr:uncharacterized protein LAESUDRAFT_759122 [Laetiporus sulphureus 93-53]KZT06606.1 hypothetical protein LAESUDRAFT_759122 [Laetiporus sulphureus 93-53]
MTVATFSKQTLGMTLGMTGIVEDNKKVEQRQALRTSGLSQQSRKIVTELRGEDLPPDHSGMNIEDVLMNIQQEGGGEDADWEDEPADESFIHALRDIMGSRCIAIIVRGLLHTYILPGGENDGTKMLGHGVNG